MFQEKYDYAPDRERILALTDKAFELCESFLTPEVLKECFSFMDLTSLHSTDTVSSVENLTKKVNALNEKFPSYPLPASICVFPDFASVVRDTRNCSDVHVTAVAGCFPASQSFPEVKALECRMAVENGADEVDIVLALNHFIAKNYDAASDEIALMRKTVDDAAVAQGRKAVLKVILETGLLSTPELIAEASFLAMEAGADFIKTSTGKVEVNATPASAVVMCECIRKFYEKTGRKVGFKAAGGISNARDAVNYYIIGKTILGDEWMNRNYFRFGVSRLGNSLISAAEQSEVAYF